MTQWTRDGKGFDKTLGKVPLDEAESALLNEKTAPLRRPDEKHKLEELRARADS